MGEGLLSDRLQGLQLFLEGVGGGEGGGGMVYIWGMVVYVQNFVVVSLSAFSV